ncbi:uncharacterized protein LOC108165346 isoform X2 [Drosophila miranda]|uniref:uncharacterized protein LOC108165346 isoform X2 n=1 Tax=Drosophila miranda TaxID=7229 RepID=UPI00143F2423|nr:uncharacterized protein LOC108165346 isoform X2 [Drosophila miranda]
MVAPEPELQQVSDSRSQPMSRLDVDAVQATNEGNRPKEIKAFDGKSLENIISDKGKPKKVSDKPKPAYKSLKRRPVKTHRDNRPLVLEERHSLSIAETKKRRASVFSKERLFIPKDLARSNLQQRASSGVNSVDKLSSNTEYCLRMLKFPVGTGRARFVAKKLKKGQVAGVQSSSKEPADSTHHQMIMADGNGKDTSMETKEADALRANPMATKEEPIDMPNLNVESALNDPVIHIQVLPVDDDDDADDDIKKKSVVPDPASGPHSMQDQCHSVIKVSTQLMSEKGVPSDQPYPCLRWHNPDNQFLDLKMGLLDDLRNIPEVEAMANYNEVENNGERNKGAERAEGQEERVQQISGILTETQQLPRPEPHQQSEMAPMLIPNDPIYPSVHHIQPPPRVEARPEPQAHYYSVPVTVNSPFGVTSNATSSEAAGEHSILCQRLLHHSVLPSVDQFQPSSACHNSAMDLTNQRYRHQHADGETQALPSAMEHPWRQQSLDPHPGHSPQTQQQLQNLFAQPPVQHHTIPHLSAQHHQVLCQQNILESIGQLEKLKVMHQNLKLQEEKQARFFHTALTTILNERAGDEHMFQYKMKQSKKAEDKLNADKEKQQRKLKADLQYLDVRIRNRQRVLSWRQHQQQLLLQNPFHQQQPLQQQHQPQQHQPEHHQPQQHQPEHRQPQQHQPEQHQPEQHQPQQHQPQQHQPEQYQPQQHQPQQHQPEQHQPQQHQPEQHQPQLQPDILYHYPQRPVVVEESHKQYHQKQQQQQQLQQHQKKQHQQRVHQQHYTAMFEPPPYIYPSSTSYRLPLNVATTAAASGSEFQAKLMPLAPLQRKPPFSSCENAKKRTKTQDVELRREINERRGVAYPTPSVEVHYPPAATATDSSSTYPPYRFQYIYKPSTPERSQEQRAPGHDREYGSAGETASTFITNYVSSYLNENMRTNK